MGNNIFGEGAAPPPPGPDNWGFYKSIDASVEYEKISCDSDKKIFNNLEYKCQIGIIDKRKNIL